MSENQNLQVVSQIDLITKAEIDMQISTAKAYPRDIARVLKTSKQLALMNEETAQSCVYALPRSGKTIDGPSVRLAEIVASNYGNLRTGARVISNDGKNIVAQGICHDLESNNCVTVEVSRKITDKNGNTYNQDMQTMTGNAACAIAFRNAIFKVIPAVLVNDIFEEAKKMARGEADKLSQNRAASFAFFNSLGIKEDKLLAQLGLKSLDEVTLEHIGTLRGMASAIKNGETSIKDMFESDQSATDKKKEMKDKKTSSENPANQMP